MAILLEIVKKSVSDLGGGPLKLFIGLRSHGEGPRRYGCVICEMSMRESSRREQLRVVRKFGVSQPTSATASPPFQHPPCATKLVTQAVLFL